MPAELVRIVGANNILTGNGWWNGSSPPPAGSSLSRVLRARDRSYDMVVARQGQPLLDAELNLMQQIVGEKLDNFVQQLSLTGWTKAPGYPIKRTDGDLSAHPTVRWNTSGIGQNVLEFRDDAWLVAKGQFIHLSNPDVDNGKYVAVDLGGNVPAINTVREDLLFVEFWYEEIGPDGLGEDDSASRLIKKAGGKDNLDYPQADINESLVDPILNIETTRRVQLRWRLRVAESTGSPSSGIISMFPTYQWGLSNTLGTPNPNISAMGATSAPIPGYYFQIVESPGGIQDSSTVLPGPARLWRTAIIGTPQASAAALQTVDGFSYAVPIMKLIRDSGNGLHGEDLRMPSRMYIPAHSIHASELADSLDLNGAGVTGGLSANGSVIERGSIKGGTTGDVGYHTVDSYNLAPGTIGEDQIQNTSINIQHIAPSIGLPTRGLLNMTAERVYNGSVVFVVGDTFVKPEAAPASIPVVGVVENYDPLAPLKNYIDIGEIGWVRLGGLAAGVLTNGTVSTFVTYAAPSSTAGYYPAAEAVTNPFGQVIKTYTHSGADPTGLNRADVLMFVENVPPGSIDETKIKNQSIFIQHINPSLIEGLDDEPTLRRLGRAGTGHATDPYRAVPSNDSRLTDSRAPTGPAGGDLTGTYPNPTIAAGVVTGAKIAAGTITDANVAAANIDGAKSTPSLRRLTTITTTLGDGSRAVADDSPVLTSSRAPTGTAGGSLAGTYPNPTIAAGAVGPTELAGSAVTTAKIEFNAVTLDKHAPNSVDTSKIIDGNVTTNKIADLNVTTGKIAANAVIDTKIGTDAIFNRHITSGSIDARNMNTDSVGTLALIDGSVTSSKVASGAITRTKIVNLEVLENHLADGAVTTNKIAGSAITAAKMAASSVAAAAIQVQAVDYSKIGLVPALRLQRNTDQIIPSTEFADLSSARIVQFEYADFDTLSSAGLPQWSAGTPTTITIRVSGIYQLNLTMAWVDVGNNGVAGNATSIRSATIQTLSHFGIASDRANPNTITAFPLFQTCTTLYYLPAGTQLQCDAQQNSGANQGIGGEAAWATTFSMVWVGPLT